MNILTLIQSKDDYEAIKQDRKANIGDIFTN